MRNFPDVVKHERQYVENNGGQDDDIRVVRVVFIYNRNQIKERQLNVV